ncbi:hypothetical protein [Brevundimonas sp.]|uniref:hypothetical protein n=1 Tax=Brevundimonas sp. TaxID=1871086 RepID=UPI0025EB72C1|nr:hypothetical protein [Brevundimonas sp.]
MRLLAAIALIVASPVVGFLVAWAIAALFPHLPAAWDAYLSNLHPLFGFWVVIGIWPVALTALALLATIGWLRPQAKLTSPWDSTRPLVGGARLAWGILAALAIVATGLPLYWLAAAMTLLALGPG